MVLYTGKSILDIANQNNFAIPAFNISDWAMFLGVMDVSEEKNAPVIIAIHPDEVSHVTTDLIVAIRAVGVGKETTVTVARDGRQVPIKVTPEPLS